MLEAGFISAEEKDQALSQPMEIVEGEEKQRVYNLRTAPYFVEWVR